MKFKIIYVPGPAHMIMTQHIFYMHNFFWTLSTCDLGIKGGGIDKWKKVTLLFNFDHKR